MFRFYVVQILLLVSLSSVKAIQISGVISDSISIQPIINAKIQLIGYPLISTISDDSGHFILNGSVSINPYRISGSEPTRMMIYNNKLNIYSDFEGIFNVSVYDLKGNRLYYNQKQVHPGQATMFAGLWNSLGVFFLRIQSDHFDQCIKINSAFQANRSLNPVTSIKSENLRKSTANFTIEVSKYGYVTKSVLVLNENANVGKVLLSISHDSINFIPFTVGDLRQFLLPDSSTLQLEIIGTALLNDGKMVFVETMQYGNGTPDTSYSYDDGQFWVSCNSFDRATDSSGNKIARYPFNEQRLALKTPHENQFWYQYDGDPTSSYRVSKYYDSIIAAFGPIKNVFGFESFNTKEDSLPLLTVCFANKIGWIGTLNSNNADSALATIVYFRVNGIEKGTMIPKRDPKAKLLKTSKFILRQNLRLLQGSTLKTKSASMSPRNRAP